MSVHSESSEMYLETIYLLEKAHGHAHGVDIAKELGVSKASVTKAMKVLKGQGCISKESYGSITLTEQGKHCAGKVYHHHQIISLFLKESLGVSEEEASANACRMEHILTDKLYEAIEAFLLNNEIEVKQ